VVRYREGLTQTWEVDIGRLAKEDLATEDLIYMRLQEVAKNYTT